MTSILIAVTFLYGIETVKCTFGGGPIRPSSLRRKCSPKNIVISDISFMAIFAVVTENEHIIDRHLRGIHPLLDYDASESQSMISILLK